MQSFRSFGFDFGITNLNNNTSKIASHRYFKSLKNFSEQLLNLIEVLVEVR